MHCLAEILSAINDTHLLNFSLSKLLVDVADIVKKRLQILGIKTLDDKCQILQKVLTEILKDNKIPIHFW